MDAKESNDVETRKAVSTSKPSKPKRLRNTKKSGDIVPGTTKSVFNQQDCDSGNAEKVAPWRYNKWGNHNLLRNESIVITFLANDDDYITLVAFLETKLR